MTLTRRSSKVAVGLAVAVLLVLGLVGGITPAFAGHGAGTANVNVHEKLAGEQDQAFTITVTHPAAPAAPFPPDPLNPPQAPAAINWVQVGAAPGFVIDSASGPLESGSPAWDVTLIKQGGQNIIALFTLKAGKTGISAGGNGAFTIQADVPRPPAERTNSNWNVATSSNGGASQAQPTGDLSTRVRVLKVDNVAITSPAGAADGTVSGLQGKSRDVDGDGLNDETAVFARCVITNHASVAHTITPSLSGGSNVIIEAAPAPASVASGASRAFDFQLSFADVSSTQSTALQCNGDSVRTDGGSGIGTTPTGFNAQTPVSIQPRAIFNYVANPNLPTFSPSALSPNRTGVPFTVVVQKTGTPGVNLAPASTRLGFLNTDGVGFAIAKTPLTSSPSVPAGNVVNFSLGFSVDVGSLANGRYPGVLDIRGTDLNDSAVGFVPLSSFNEKLLIDAGIPFLDLNVTPPALPTGWPAGPDYDYVARAVRSGQTLGLGGSITDFDPDLEEDAPCGTCTIVPGSAVLRQYETEIGGAISGPDLPVTLSVNTTTGAVSGSFSGSYAPTTRSVVLVARAVDKAGNETELINSTGCGWCPARFSDAERALLSGRAVVDPVVPEIVSIRTQRGSDGSQNRLLVTLSECAYGVTQAADWTFVGAGVTQSVTAVEPASGIPNCAVSNPAPMSSGGSLVLRTSEPMPDDDAADEPLPQLRYMPVGGSVLQTASNRFRDRTGSTVADVTKQILDGISPLAPVIQSIELPSHTELLGTHDGAFWTNIDTPKFLLVNPAGQEYRAIRAGYTAELWQETNGVAGLQRSGDVRLGSEQVERTDGGNCDEGDPPTEPGIACTVMVEADFTVPGASSADTSQSEAAHTLYAVALDSSTPANAGDAGSALVEIDRIKPQVDMTNTAFEAADITVAFNDSLRFGQDRAGDWRIVDDSDFVLFMSAVQGTGQANSRRLVPFSGYDPDAVMLFSWIYFGPAGGRYEDRATNTLLDFETCVKDVPGSSICPA